MIINPTRTNLLFFKEKAIAVKNSINILRSRRKALIREFLDTGLIFIRSREEIRNIHLNPVRAGLVERPERYQWSSYQYYIGRRREPEWLRVDLILEFFGKKLSTAQKRYREFVNAFLNKEYENPLKKTVASTILGGIDFVGEIKDKYLNNKKVDRNLPALAELTTWPMIQEISNEVKAVLGEDTALSKKATLYLCHRYSGRTLKEIGSYFGIGESSVSQASCRFKLTLDNDRKLRRKIQHISKRLKL